MVRLFLALVAAAVWTGCAPPAALRVPAYTGPEIATGRLLVLSPGPVDATDEVVQSTQAVDRQAAEGAVWDGLAAALSETYSFTNVRVDTLPAASALVPVFTSRQVVSERRAENRWIRRMVNLPSAPVVGVPAEYVLVLDTVRVVRRMGEDGFHPGRIRPRDIAVTAAVAVLTGVVVVPATPVPGTAIRAPYALYRVGESVPLVVGEMNSFAGGDDGVSERSALARSLQRLVSSLGESGALRPR
ncbi:MAG TPA: hypothetical protein VGB53_02860 [Rubricoccaceae bacterium]|jgi:hypothetical protein